MFDLGRIQELKIREINHSGALLEDPEQPFVTVLLPGKQIPKGAGPGTVLEVFLYRDSEDRIIATTKRPALMLGEIAYLTVASVTDIGAFLDWGLDRDLFLPFREQRGTLRKGQKVLVTLYIDKSGRLAASMNIYDRLSADSPYQTGDRVDGIVYELSDTMGALVAVDDRYFGLIPRQELYSMLKVGDRVHARVIKVRPDGKLNLSIRKKAYAQMSDDADKVLRVIGEFGGELPFNDNASPEVIQRELELSKAAFKRAVGRLLRQGRIEITDHSIRSVAEADQPDDRAENREKTVGSRTAHSGRGSDREAHSGSGKSGNSRGSRPERQKSVGNRDRRMDRGHTGSVRANQPEQRKTGENRDRRMDRGYTGSVRGNRPEQRKNGENRDHRMDHRGDHKR